MQIVRAGKSNKRLYIIAVFGVFLVIAILYICLAFQVVVPRGNDCTIGIIDGSLSKEYKNVISNQQTGSPELTHGDSMIIFAKNYCPSIEIYYYNAENAKGLVDTDSILKGLAWMLENNVGAVNISMSSTKFSEKLQAWITKNAEDIHVHASYNNLEESWDYPAMYDNVVGAGVKNRVKHKDNAVLFSSNNILLLGSHWGKYSGNSYLSLLCIITDNVASEHSK